MIFKLRIVYVEESSKVTRLVDCGINAILILTLSQSSPWFYVSAVSLLKLLWKKEKLLIMSNFSFSGFPSVFYTLLKKFLPFSSNIDFSSPNSFSLEVSKIFFFFFFFFFFLRRVKNNFVVSVVIR